MELRLSRGGKPGGLFPASRVNIAEEHRFGGVPHDALYPLRVGALTDFDRGECVAQDVRRQILQSRVVIGD